MKVQERIDLMVRLGEYMKSEETARKAAQERAEQKNGWFIPEFTDLAIKQIAESFLNRELLQAWAEHYRLDDNIESKLIGIVMAGNIPLVGFHDMLTVFISGHRQSIKLSSKDEILLPHLISVCAGWDERVNERISFEEMLRGCDAYIATGSNNTARVFREYFGAYPSIIRGNKTSVAIIIGKENPEELNGIADDIHLYFGMGCRSVTKLYVPRGYDFEPLIKSFAKYEYLKDHNKQRNNFDYQLSILILNNQYYMSSGALLLTENKSLFAPPAMVHYEFYDDVSAVQNELAASPDVQCCTGGDRLLPGTTQQPGLFDYADGVDTMQFLLGL